MSCFAPCASGSCADGGGLRVMGRGLWLGVEVGGGGRATRAMPIHDDGAVMNGAPGLRGGRADYLSIFDK